MVILIDEIDYDLLKYNWRLHGNGYLRAHDITLREIYLHKLIAERMNLFGNIDHKNRNKIDNRRNNLRLATAEGQGANRDIQKNNTSGYRGICLHHGKWQVSIRYKTKLKYCGSYETIEKAVFIYNKYAKYYHKEFAVLQ